MSILTDVTEKLMDQINTLSNQDMSHENLLQEAERAKALTGLSQQIIGACRLALDAQISLGTGHATEATDMLGIKLPEKKTLTVHLQERNDNIKPSAQFAKQSHSGSY
jgi:hypothetical protein